MILVLIEKIGRKLF